MPTVTNWSPTQSNPQVHSGIATIDAGQTTTLGIPSNGRAVVQLSFPTGFAGTTVTFLVQIMPNYGTIAAGVTVVPFQPLVDDSNNPVSIVVSPGTVQTVPELSGVYAFQIVSGSTEVASRAILVSCKGLEPVPWGSDPGPTAVYGTVDTISTPTAAATAASSQYHPLTTVTAVNLQATQTNLLHFLVTNANAAVRYAQFHNKSTTPVATNVPVMSYLIPAGTATVPGFVEFQFDPGAQFGMGLGFSLSTTQGTFTNSATATDHTVHVEFI